MNSTPVVDYLEENRDNLLDLLRQEEIKKFKLQIKHEVYKDLIELQFKKHIVNIISNDIQKNIPLDYLLIYTEVENWMYGESLLFDGYSEASYESGEMDRKV